MDSIHPVREDIDKYLRGGLNSPGREEVKKHLQKCEFCEELIENLKSQLEWGSNSSAEDKPPDLKYLADKLFDQSKRMRSGGIVKLTPLDKPITGPSAQMAADGQAPRDRDLENLVTVFSENPDIVLLLMKDNKADELYVQVVSDDPSLYENMLVELPDIGRSIITDSNGRARIDDIDPCSVSDMRWQIRLPDAVFDLEAMTFDPDHTQYRKETILESEQGDSIRISLEGKGDGKQIELEVLRLDGNTKFGPLQMVVTIDDNIQSFNIDNNKSVVIETEAKRGKIRIRLYT